MKRIWEVHFYQDISVWFSGSILYINLCLKIWMLCDYEILPRVVRASDFDRILIYREGKNCRSVARILSIGDI